MKQLKEQFVKVSHSFVKKAYKANEAASIPPPVKKLWVWGLSKIPLQNVIVFESKPDFSDNTAAFFKYLSERKEILSKYKFVWILSDPKSIRKSFYGIPVICILRKPSSIAESIKKIWYLNSARYIVDSNLFVFKRKPEQIRIHLFHGMLVKDVPEYIKTRKQADVAVTTSPIFHNGLACSDDLPDTLVPLGSPRNDVLVRNRNARLHSSEKSIIWMPTYRQHKDIYSMRSEVHLPFGLPLLQTNDDFAELNNTLSDNSTRLYIRLHPGQDTKGIVFSNFSNITLCDDNYLHAVGMDLYSFLALKTDALITDYSSVYYDYLLLDRPIALCWEDLKEFSTRWSMYLPNYEYAYHCEMLHSLDDLFGFIKQLHLGVDHFTNGRKIDVAAYHTYADDKACERLYCLLCDKYRFNEEH